MRSLAAAILLLLAGGGADAKGELFYFDEATYTECPDFSATMPTWTIEGRVSGPWIEGTMQAKGALTKKDTVSFQFETKWTITSNSGATLLSASCKGTSLLEPMEHSKNAPWWEECKITSGSGEYASYSNRYMLTSGFAPTTPCVANKSFISGYKVVVD
jgi:hypothetical protein